MDNVVFFYLQDCYDAIQILFVAEVARSYFLRPNYWNR